MQIVRLQDRTSGYLAELDELKTAKSSRSLLATAGGETVSAAAATAAVPGGAAAGAAHMAKTAQADKELMLKQIDSLKEVSLIMRPARWCLFHNRVLHLSGSQRMTDIQPSWCVVMRVAIIWCLAVL